MDIPPTAGLGRERNGGFGEKSKINRHFQPVIKLQDDDQKLPFVCEFVGWAGRKGIHQLARARCKVTG